MSNKKENLRFLIHPAFLSLVVTAFIVLLFIPAPGKYILQIEDEIYHNYTSSILYDDLDGNGYSDKIEIQYYAGKNNVASLQISCNPFLSFNEWDFKGSYSFADRSFLITGDYNNDGKKEIYVFTLRSDSVFLNIIKDPKSIKPVSTSRFITTYKPWNGKPQLCVNIGGLADMNKDSFKDLVFAINSGFSLDPRNLYIYDIRNDSLKVSEKIGYYGKPTVIQDLNGDGYNEIILNGYAVQNVSFKDTITTPIHDRCCWLIVYDHNLNYLFPPRKFPDIGYSALTTFAIPGKTGHNEMFGWYIPPQSSGKSLSINQYDKEGKIIKSCSVPGNNLGGFANGLLFSRGKSDYLALCISDNEINCYGTALNLAFKINIKPGMFNYPDTFDVDADGVKEIISIDPSRNMLTVFRSDLIDPASVKLPVENWDHILISGVEKPGAIPRLVIFNGTSELQLSYKYNPYYYSRWAIYVAIFLAIYLFILLIRKIQKNQILKQQQTEKKITELQMKVVRNQMDPHFTMNAINSVISAINENEKEQATKHLIYFSKMYRHLVLTADKIKCTLAEELDFTQNYLTMEQFRFRDKFDFDFEIPPELNLNLEVPKMVIQSPVENAVKHGLINLPGKGHLKVSANTTDHVLILEITDNGVGRVKAAKLSLHSTGKGMKAMEEFLKLYQKVTGLKAETTIEDLTDKEGNPTGTKVTVKIQIIRPA